MAELNTQKVPSSGRARRLKEPPRTDKSLIVIIKPSDKSNYKNLVDILDEMEITQVTSFAIADITATELARMERDGL